MGWWAVDVTPSEPTATGHALAAWLVARTGQAIEERDDGTFVTFAEDETAANALVAALATSVDPAARAALRPLDMVDWSTRWRAGLGPRRFGRLVVTPSWEEAGAGPEEVVVVLDPEMAFGSGEHGSTRAALALLVRHLAAGQRVLDLGSGSGILSVAAARLGAARATGIEVDADANLVADRNAARNDVAAACRFIEGDAAHLAELLGPVDLLLSNILRSVNLTLLPAIRGALAPGGLAIFSGMEVGEAPLFRPELAAAGFAVVDEQVDGSWWAVAGRAP
ncbi:MAG TPA: 50S ribosomal protein L11 methyltransferase [Gemmatimonadales bacterium]|nr:50S ribosomal protein L11 methyltransferase [Gemmatimonadales bacterium]